MRLIWSNLMAYSHVHRPWSAIGRWLNFGRGFTESPQSIPLVQRLEIAASLSNLATWEYWPSRELMIGDAATAQFLGCESTQTTNMLSVWRECLEEQDKAQAILTRSDDADRSRNVASDCEPPIRITTRHGDVRYLRVASKSIHGKTGDAVFVGTFHDVTQQWLTEERLRSTLHAARIEVWDCDLTTKSNEVSSDHVHRLSIDPHNTLVTNAIGLKEWMSSVHEDDWEGFHQQLETYREGNPSIFQCEYRIKERDGNWRWVQDVGAAIQRNPDGSPIRMLGVRIDHQDAQVMANCLDLAITAADAGIWDWHIPTGNVKTNRRYHEMLGEKDRDTPLTIEEFQRRVHPVDYERVLEKVAHSHANEDVSYSVEFRLQCADGTYKWIHSAGRVIQRDRAGAPIRMIGQHVDIDLHRRTLQSIEQLNEQLEQQIAVANRMARRAESANRAKSQFLANMSHEIRTPLTAILGYSETLSEAFAEQPGYEDSVRSVETIHRNGEHLLSVINDILDLSKIEEGRLTLEKIEFSPRELLQEIDTLMRVRAEQKSIQWNVAVDGKLPCRVHSDPTRLRQILLNLVGNAMKFTESGSVRLVAHAKTVSQGAWLEFMVIDTGVGMTKQDMNQLFQPFVQADSSMSRRFGGTGLGLTISRQLARMLGGDIHVESEVGLGSIFRVNVLVGLSDTSNFCSCQSAAQCQLKRIESPEATDPTSSMKSVLQGVHCLLVEDGLDNQRLIEMILRKAGATIEVCENGQEGVDEFMRANQSDKPFDVVLMDMQMPIMDGYTATRLLRQQGQTIPVIALTAHAMAESRQACLNAGCDDFATKPIDRRQLVELVRRYGVIERDAVT